MNPRVEILKMATKMAASKALKTYLTNELDKKAFKFDFLWLFRGLMIQTIKMENWFGTEGSNIKDGVQNGRHFKAKFNQIAIKFYFPIVYNSGCIWSI